MRAAIQHNLLFGNPRRLYYYGPMFRHERPQKGRYRQFHQFGIEAICGYGPEYFAATPFGNLILPDDLPAPLALAVLDVCGAPAQTARIVTTGQTVAILGAGGKSGFVFDSGGAQSGGRGLVVFRC